MHSQASYIRLTAYKKCHSGAIFRNCCRGIRSLSDDSQTLRTPQLCLQQKDGKCDELNITPTSECHADTLLLQ